MKFIKTLVFAMLVGCGSVFLAQGCVDTEAAPKPLLIEIVPRPIVIVEKIAPLERARRATFLISSKQEGFSGSAFLVARIKIPNGYEYRALTAYHVIDGADSKLMATGIDSVGEIECIFQPRFHGLPLRFTTRFTAIDWTSPSEDWGSFKFVTTHKLECMPVATRKEFKQLTPYEDVYIIGCAGGMTPMCRQGHVASTHNEYSDLPTQRRRFSQWHKQPRKFFRFSGGAWYGDSGGVIVNKHGKAIGIINGYAIMHKKYGPVNFIAAALKTYLIVELTRHSKDFFKVEE